MKRTLSALMILGLFAVVPGLSTEAKIDGEIQARAEKTLVLDVACDARTFGSTRGDDIDALRGDGFIVQEDLPETRSRRAARLKHRARSIPTPLQGLLARGSAAALSSTI